jgi:ACS family 4-hydroxyphenylacetate permease-like MFS transporter
MTDFSTGLPAQATRAAIKAAYVDPAVLHSAMTKVSRRLVWFLFLLFFVACLERMNMGFAGPAIIQALGMTGTQFGFAMTLFYLAYTVCAIPANMILMRVGARRWIGASMMVWGLTFVATIFVTNAQSMYVARLLVGAIEAGLVPGLVLYIVHWFPAAYRARAMVLFVLALPAASMVGAALSGYILRLDGAWGLRGWQWLIMLSRMPGLIIGLVVFVKLLDSPRQAKWLTPGEKRAVTAVLDAEHRIADARGVRVSFWRELFSSVVIRYALTYFLLVNALAMTGIWVPLLIQSLIRAGSNSVAVGLLAAIPQFVAIVVILIVGGLSDHFRERKWHLFGSLVVSVLGWFMTACGGVIAVRLAGLCLASGGVYSAMAVFWTTPDYAFSHRVRAVGIAAITAFGNIAAIINPSLMGWLHDRTGGFSAGAVYSGILLIAAAALVLTLPISRKALGHAQASRRTSQGA